MSFGGAIAGEICMIDKRCAAGVNLDGGNYPFSSFNAAVPAPFLMFHSDLREPLQHDGNAPAGHGPAQLQRVLV